MENNMKLNKLLLIRSVFTACIEDQDIIDRILAHLTREGTRHSNPPVTDVTISSTP